MSHFSFSRFLKIKQLFTILNRKNAKDLNQMETSNFIRKYQLVFEGLKSV